MSLESSQGERRESLRVRLKCLMLVVVVVASRRMRQSIGAANE